MPNWPCLGALPTRDLQVHAPAGASQGSIAHKRTQPSGAQKRDSTATPTAPAPAATSTATSAFELQQPPGSSQSPPNIEQPQPIAAPIQPAAKPSLRASFNGE